MPNPQWWPLDNIHVTGAWGNSPAYYAEFGQRGHNGIDLKAAINTPVYAVDDGTILMEGWKVPWSGAVGGVAVIIKHAWGHSGYAHLNSTIVDVNQRVKRGQLIGYSGMTGVGTGPHLHFETFPLNVAFNNGFSGRVNPSSIIDLRPRGTNVIPVPNTPPSQKILTEFGEEMFILVLQKKHYYLVLPQGSAKPAAVLLGGEADANGAFAKLPVIPAWSAQFTMNDLGKTITGIRPEHLKAV